MKNLLFITLFLLTGSGVLCAPQAQATNFDYYNPNEADYETNDDIPSESDSTNVESTLPVFVSKSKKITVKEGETVQVSCKIVKKTPHVLLFQHILPDQTIILFAGNSPVFKSDFVKEGDMFTLKNARRGSSGTYSCAYQTGHGNIELKYEIDVQYPAMIKPMKQTKHRVSKGKNVSLPCKADGNPKPVITWKKENGKLPSGKKEEEGESITLLDVDRHVEGTYVCTAYNGLGEPVSASVRLHVEYAPEIITRKEIIRTGEGDKVELECIVHARPKAVVKWSKEDNQNLIPPKFQEFNKDHSHTLIINDITEKEYGTYTCLASNKIGADNATINLTDLPMQPMFTSDPISSEDNEYTLAWKTESFYPITEYSVKYKLLAANGSDPSSWTEKNFETAKQETMVETDNLEHRMKHTISGLEAATEYEAVVRVKNTVRWGNASSFRFSTKKESTSTYTGGSSAVTWSLSLLIACRLASIFS